MGLCDSLLVVLGLYVIIPKLLFIILYIKKAYGIKSYESLASKFKTN